MFEHLTPENPFDINLNTIKVDVLGVQYFTTVDAESYTVDLGRALLYRTLVFDSNLGFALCKERVVDFTFIVLSLSHQFMSEPGIVETYAGFDNVKVEGLDELLLVWHILPVLDE